MPYSYNGYCYASNDAVLSAVSSSFPVVDSTGSATLSGVPSLSPSGVLSYSVQSSPYTGTGSISTQIIQLPTCTQTWVDYPLSFVLFLVALFFAFGIGFSHGRSLA